MSGTKKKPRQTSESMESPSAKQRRSSTTPTQASNRTLSGKKSDSESQAGRKEAQKSSSLSLSTVRSRQGKKSTESSAHDALIQKRKRVWQGYDNESLPELNMSTLTWCVPGTKRPIAKRRFSPSRSACFI